MPIYTYQCSACEAVFDVHHSMKETKTDCTQCKAENTLTRIPSLNYINTAATPNADKKVGQVVNEHIREAQHELRQEKEKLKNQIIEVEPND